MRVIVQSGNIVQAAATRMVPVASSTMTNGLVTRTKPVQEAVIAVAPGEVARLTEALAVGAEISCVPRSGRPDDPRDSLTPESDPWSPYGGTIHRPKAVSNPGGFRAARASRHRELLEPGSRLSKPYPEINAKSLRRR